MSESSGGSCNNKIVDEEEQLESQIKQYIEIAKRKIKDQEKEIEKANKEHKKKVGELRAQLSIYKKDYRDREKGYLLLTGKFKRPESKNTESEGAKRK